MYINSGDQLHELSQQQDILGAGVTPTWTRGNALADMLPNSAIACANSFISQSLLPGDRSTSGREVLRVFYFERGTGNLREVCIEQDCCAYVANIIFLPIRWSTNGLRAGHSLT